MADIFYNLLTKATSQNVANKVSQSRNWLMSKARNVSIRSSRSVISQADTKTRSLGNNNSFIGKMMLFQYQATTAEKLPYWDQFPLVFPFRVEGDGFYGINFHYLPYMQRARLLDALYKYATNEDDDGNITDETRLRITYEILMASSRSSLIKPCVKHYLNRGLRSQFAIVPPSEWEVALFLPLEQFRKGKSGSISSARVHADSMKTSRR